MKRCTGSSRWTSGLARPGSFAVAASLDEGTEGGTIARPNRRAGAEHLETPDGAELVGPNRKGPGITVSGLREAAVASGLTVVRN